MQDLIIQIIAGCLVALITLFITFGLIRLAANVVILLVMAIGFGIIIYSIVSGAWVGWTTIITYSAATGVATALLSLPALPFSSFSKKD